MKTILSDTKMIMGELNRDIPKERLDKIKLLVFDSDGVCVERGTFIQEKFENNVYEINIKTNVI